MTRNEFIVLTCIALLLFLGKVSRNCQRMQSISIYKTSLIVKLVLKFLGIYDISPCRLALINQIKCNPLKVEFVDGKLLRRPNEPPNAPPAPPPSAVRGARPRVVPGRRRAVLHPAAGAGHALRRPRLRQGVHQEDQQGVEPGGAPAHLEHTDQHVQVGSLTHSTSLRDAYTG